MSIIVDELLNTALLSLDHGRDEKASAYAIVAAAAALVEISKCLVILSGCVSSRNGEIVFHNFDVATDNHNNLDY